MAAILDRVKSVFHHFTVVRSWLMPEDVLAVLENVSRCLGPQREVEDFPDLVLSQ